MQNIRDLLTELTDINMNKVSDQIVVTMVIIVGLLVVASFFALFVSIYLAIAYAKYNRMKNTCGKTGEEAARLVLDNNELEHIKVSKNGSILFGNSYSHFFKKVRLRRLTWKKDSITSLSIAVQKASLAILDKEGDPDMAARIRMTPVIYFGPLAFIPLILIGLLLDLFVFRNVTGLGLMFFTLLGLIIYIISFVMSVKVLKTEKKAQEMALKIMKKGHLATAEEIEMSKKLFQLYNIEYINNMIIALLELVYRVLQIIAYFESSLPSKD